MMKEKRDKVYINRREYETEFIRLIETWGKDYIEGEYEVTDDEEIIHLRLKLDEESPDCMSMRMPNSEECEEGFIRNKEDQEKFFRGKGKELVKKELMMVEEIERIKIPGYEIRSTHTIIEIKRCQRKKLNQK